MGDLCGFLRKPCYCPLIKDWLCPRVFKQNFRILYPTFSCTHSHLSSHTQSFCLEVFELVLMQILIIENTLVIYSHVLPFGSARLKNYNLRVGNIWPSPPCCDQKGELCRLRISATHNEWVGSQLTPTRPRQEFPVPDSVCLISSRYFISLNKYIG